MNLCHPSVKIYSAHHLCFHLAQLFFFSPLCLFICLPAYLNPVLTDIDNVLSCMSGISYVHAGSFNLHVFFCNICLCALFVLGLLSMF